MDEKEKLDNLTREQNELRQMINSGVTFDVDITYKNASRDYWALFASAKR